MGGLEIPFNGARGVVSTMFGIVRVSWQLWWWWWCWWGDWWFIYLYLIKFDYDWLCLQYLSYLSWFCNSILIRMNMMNMVMVMMVMTTTLLMAASPTTHRPRSAARAGAGCHDWNAKAQEQTWNWWGSDSVQALKILDQFGGYKTGWWLGTFFIFPYIGNNHPNGRIFFRGVQTTNQKNMSERVRRQGGTFQIMKVAKAWQPRL